ncbi:hypothetical protein NMY22_g8542 [Coprinellus aureogranulatus]|nr:hypothetical protein NMY22_g8542 [Coprinellus aureogranulatus]
MPDSFASRVKGDVITPDHPDYASAIKRWARNAERKAQVVVFVKDAEDVAEAISYAKANNLPIAIRGGGHNAAGASSIENGLVIDLSKYLNKVRVDEESKLAYVGGGAKWRDVDEEAIKYGLATVGGRVNDTGVAGLTLGGGYGWLTGKYGLTIDNLKQVTIVTADGSILTASDSENTDLFWAVRGGGSNFGVVTEFVFHLYEQRKTVFAGLTIFTPDKLGSLIELTKKWYENAKEDEGLSLANLITPQGFPAVGVVLFYNGSEEEGRANFKGYYDIGPVMDFAKEIPFEQLNALTNNVVPAGNCYYLRGFSHNGPDYQCTFQALQKVGEIAKGGIFTPSVLFEYLPIAKIHSVDTSATAFRRQTSPNVLVMIKWDGSAPERTYEAKGLVTELADIFTASQEGLSASEKLGYSNYGHDVDEVPTLPVTHPSMAHVASRAQLVFGDNYPRLQEIKRKYDPDSIFNLWYPIVPAV